MQIQILASRPAKRGGQARLTLKDLRAIPFVGSWSQVKQNVTGYYGVGTALKKAQEQGHFNEIKNLYKQSLYFKTLIDNCEMAMKKCYFPLTAYLNSHPEYKELWQMIYEEYELTLRYILLLPPKLNERHLLQSLLSPLSPSLSGRSQPGFIVLLGVIGSRGAKKD